MHRCALDRLASPSSVLVVAAHPDDEVIGLGASLARLTRLGAVVRIVHVTDGAPRDPELRPALRHVSRERAAAARREELAAALDAGSVDRRILLEPLGVADQEAALVMPWIARTLARALEGSPADVIVTHPYEGGHPDHDAAALAVAAARRLLERAGAPAPLHAEMSSYHADGAELRTARFLPSPCPPCERLVPGRLTDDERATKRRMLDAFGSQRDVLAAFSDAAEPLRCAPAYDFSSPPHAGTLHYERLPFGWTGERWRALARDALRELSLGE